MEKKSRNILLISAVTVAVSGTIAVGMAAHAISKEKQPFVSLPWFMGKYERNERIKAINHLIKKAKESENVKDINRDFKETPKVDNINPKTSYICFGDDAPYGVNLMGKNGYPELVAKALNIDDFHNYACRTFGSNEVRRLIDENYKIPKHFENINKVLFNDNTDIEAIREQIKNADLITLDFGHVDFCYYLFYRVLNKAGIPVNCLSEIRVFFEKGRNTKAFKRIRNIKNEFDRISEILEEPNPGIINYLTVGTHIGIASTLSFMTAGRLTIYTLSSLIEIGKNFRTNEKEILKEIKKLNSSATVIMLGAYNPFRNVRINESSNLTIGRLITPFYSFINTIMYLETKHDCNYLSLTLYPSETCKWTLKEASQNPVCWTIEKIGMRQKRNPLFPSHKGHEKTAEAIIKKIKKNK